VALLLSIVFRSNEDMNHNCMYFFALTRKRMCCARMIMKHRKRMKRSLWMKWGKIKNEMNHLNFSPYATYQNNLYIQIKIASLLMFYVPLPYVFHIHNMRMKNVTRWKCLSFTFTTITKKNYVILKNEILCVCFI
jgi:hypothetical protein